MINLNNIHLRKTPFTNKIELVSVNSKNIVTARRALSENEIYDCLVQLIDYMNENGADTIENPETGEKWIFRKEADNENRN